VSGQRTAVVAEREAVLQSSAPRLRLRFMVVGGVSWGRAVAEGARGGVARVRDMDREGQGGGGSGWRARAPGGPRPGGARGGDDAARARAASHDGGAVSLKGVPCVTVD